MSDRSQRKLLETSWTTKPHYLLCLCKPVLFKKGKVLAKAAYFWPLETRQKKEVIIFDKYEERGTVISKGNPASKLGEGFFI